jgi:hypothetical protein
VLPPLAVLPPQVIPLGAARPIGRAHLEAWLARET